MGIPTREARLAHARIHCDYWNEGRKDEWVASWRTIAQGDVRMFDPVGTKEKRRLDHATLSARRCSSRSCACGRSLCMSMAMRWHGRTKTS